MNIWHIARKELSVLRKPAIIVFLLVIPIGLTLLLGTLLSNAFHQGALVGEIRILYRIDATGAALRTAWEAYASDARSAGFDFVQVESDDDGRTAVERQQAIGFAVVSEGGIRFAGNSGKPVESGIAQGHLATFADRYKLASAIAATDGSDASALAAASAPASPVAVTESAPYAAAKPSALDYYAIAMVTLIVMFTAMSAAQTMDEERKRGTAVRLLASPLTKTEVFAGKLLGLFLLNALSVTAVVLACKYMLQVNWGDNVPLVLLVLFTEVVFAISLGLGCSYLFRGPAAGAVVMTIIQVGAFIGGSYFPLEEVTGILRTITRFSPLTWTNDGLLQLIYAANASAAGSAMALNLGFSALLLGIALLILRRREGV